MELEKIDKVLDKLLKDFSIGKIEEMKVLTPVKTGLLKSSFKSIVKDGKMSVFNSCKYSIYVDKGTKYQRARNFTAPLYEKDDLNKLERDIANLIGKKIVFDIKGTIEKGIKII